MSHSLLEEGIFEDGDLNVMLDTCHSLFRTHEGLETRDYYDP